MSPSVTARPHASMNSSMPYAMPSKRIVSMREIRRSSRLLGGLARILHGWNRRKLDVPQLSVHLLDLADINVLHDFASRRVDRDRTTRALPRVTLHRIHQRFTV